MMKTMLGFVLAALAIPAAAKKVQRKRKAWILFIGGSSGSGLLQNLRKQRNRGLPIPLMAALEMMHLEILRLSCRVVRALQSFRRLVPPAWNCQWVPAAHFPDRRSRRDERSDLRRVTDV